MNPLERRVDKIAEVDKQSGIKFKGGANVLNLKREINKAQSLGKKGGVSLPPKEPPKRGV
jgi:hypothetical protein